MSDHQHAPCHYSRAALGLRDDPSGARYWSVALNQTQLTYFEVPVGAQFEGHEHPSEQITHVLEGELIFEFDSHSVVVSAGEVIAIPGNVPHAVVAGPVGARAVDAWSPVRRDIA